jgi:hypothetical protein
MACAGFDRDVYPGDAIITKLAATNVKWCGYYLHPAPSHSDDSWMGKREFLVGLGLGLAPLYVGEQVVAPGSLHPSGPKGTIDGQQAVALMAGDGFPASSYVYLDLENGPPLLPELRDYVVSWCTAVASGGYSPGIYVSHLLAQQVQNLQPDARIWAIKVSTTQSHPVPGPPYPDPDPSGSGFADAFLWQCHQNCQITVPEVQQPLTIDLDTAISTDPSSPAAVG